MTGASFVPLHHLHVEVQRHTRMVHPTATALVVGEMQKQSPAGNLTPLGQSSREGNALYNVYITDDGKVWVRTVLFGQDKAHGWAELVSFSSAPLPAST